MQKVFFRLIIILTIIILFLVIIQNESIKGYYRSIILKKIDNLKESGINIDYEELEISYIRIVIKKLSISNEFFSAQFDNITVRPKLLSLLKKNLEFSINCYYGNINVDLSNQKSGNNLAFSGELNFFKTDLAIKNINYNGKLLEISETDIFGYCHFGSGFTEFDLKNKKIVLEGELKENEHSFNLKAEDIDIKKYSEFLKDFSNIEFLNGLFDVDMKIINTQKEKLIEGFVFLKKIDVNMNEIPFKIKNVNGKVQISNDKRIFSNVGFNMNGVDLILEGERIRKTSSDLKIFEKVDESNFMRIYGEDNNLSIDGELCVGKLKLNLKKENVYKLNLSYGNIKGIFFLENNMKKGNFRILFPYNTSFWGDFLIDEKYNVRFEKCFIRAFDKIYNTDIIKNDEIFKIFVSETGKFVYSFKTGDVDLSFENSILNEKLTGVLNLDKRLLNLNKKDHTDFIRIDLLNNILECDYEILIKKIEKKDINISNAFIRFVSDNSKFEFSGKCENIGIFDYNSSDIFFKGKYEEGSFLMDFNKALISLRFYQENISGFIKDIALKIPYSGKNISISSSKIDFNSNGNKFLFEPEELDIIFDSYELKLKAGKFLYSDEKLYSEDIIFKLMEDTVEVEFDYFQKALTYSGRIVGNSMFEYNGVKIRNKVARFTGVDRKISGYIIVDNAIYSKLQDWNINGKVDFNSENISFKDLEFKNKKAVLNASGCFNIKDLEDFSFDIRSDIPNILKFKTDKFDFESIVLGKFAVISNNKGFKVSGDVDLKESVLRVLYLSDKTLPFEFEDLKINVDKAEIKYKSHRFIVSGKVNIDSKDVDVIDMRINGGHIDIIGNKFSIVSGNIATADIFSNINKNIVNIHKNGKRLQTEYKVNLNESINTIDNIEDIKKNIWYDMTLKKVFSDITVYSSVKGKGEDVSFVLYSEPEKSEEEIYDILKQNSIFGLIDSNDPKEKLFELLGLQKTFMKNFTKKLNFDSVDVKKENDDYNIFLKKRFNENIYLNYEKALRDEEETYGIEYRFNDRMKIESSNSQDESSLRLKWKINF